MTTAQQLDAWLQAVASRAFCWQTWHCGHFAADWVLLATGHAMALGLPPQQEPRAWARALAQAGGMRGHLLRHTGAKALPGFMAQVGDVVMLPGRVVPQALGVCAGSQVACVAHTGVAMRPLLEAAACWRLADLAATRQPAGAAA